MEAMFSGRHPVQEIDGIIYLDRNPDIFKYVIQYLRGDKVLPSCIDKDTKMYVEKELEWWGLEKRTTSLLD